MFNNAGIPGSANTRIREMEKEDMEKVLSINVIGAFLGAKHAARVMVPAKKGSILFTSSVASLICVAPSHAYNASKHAVVGLTKSVGIELGQFGIRVNCISPYGIATPMTKKGFGMEEEECEKLIALSANLKGVVPKAEDIAQAALFLASEESKYISGLNLVVDGGFSIVNPSLAILLDQGKA